MKCRTFNSIPYLHTAGVRARYWQWEIGGVSAAGPKEITHIFLTDSYNIECWTIYLSYKKWVQTYNVYCSTVLQIICDIDN